MDEMKRIKRAAAVVDEAIGTADIGVILGSGLGGFEESLIGARSIDYADIPGFPKSTVAGHASRFVSGTLRDKRVLVMSGRFHHYEGHSLKNVVLPIRVMALLGVKTLIVTNAAGGVSTHLSPGDLMLITDYLNLSGHNPLRGPNLDEFGPRFPDMSRAFDRGLADIARQEAERLGIPLKEGVYAFWNGPSYESPAEIRMVRTLGADAVGMSTVPEVITARHAGLRVMGLSCITNMAAGVLDVPINHEEVLAIGRQVRASFRSLVENIIDKMPDELTDNF